jgi:hypothetical protein
MKDLKIVGGVFLVAEVNQHGMVLTLKPAAERRETPILGPRLNTPELPLAAD